MKKSIALLTLPAILAIGATADAQVVNVGDVPTYSLEKAFNTMGSSKASDFLGKPILVDFWGTR